MTSVRDFVMVELERAYGPSQDNERVAQAICQLVAAKLKERLNNAD